jgi:hypothetical protein
LRVVATKVLAKELRARAVQDAENVCSALMMVPAEYESAAPLRPSPEDVFKRLGR